MSQVTSDVWSAGDRHMAAVAGGEAQRLAARERAIAVLGAIITWGAIGFMMAGSRPFTSDLLAASDLSPVTRYAWLILFALSVPVLWLRRQHLAGVALALWPILLLYAWFTLTTHWALDPAASIRRLLQSIVALIVCVAIAMAQRSPARLHALICVPCLAIVTIDLLSWPIIPGQAMTPLGLQGMHGQKNMLGMYSMYTLLAAVSYGLGRPASWPRRFALGASAIALATLLASRSGTSIGLTFGAAVIVPGLVYLLRRRGLVLSATLCVMLGVLVAGLGLYVMWCGIAGADPLAPLAGVTFTKRTDLWSFLIQQIHLRPLGGAGYGSFWAIDKAVQPSLHSGLWFGLGKTIAPEGHNAYLDVAAATGLVGLALGLLTLFWTILRAAQMVRSAAVSAPAATPAVMPLATAAFYLAFCIVVAGHSMTESTLFSADSQLGTLFFLSAVAVEWSRLQTRPRQWRPRPGAMRLGRAVPQRPRSAVAWEPNRRRSDSIGRSTP